MKTKKIVLTAVCLVGIVLLGIVWKVINYQVDMYYSSQVAPKQFDDDKAYSMLTTHQGVHTISSIVGVLLVLLLIFGIFKIWKKKIVITSDAS